MFDFNIADGFLFDPLRTFPGATGVSSAVTVQALSVTVSTVFLSATLQTPFSVATT